MPVIVALKLKLLIWMTSMWSTGNHLPLRILIFFSHLYHHIVHYILEVRLFILSGLIDITKPASITILTTLRLTILLWSFWRCGIKWRTLGWGLLLVERTHGELRGVNNCYLLRINLRHFISFCLVTII